MPDEVKPVPDALRDLGDIYRERNAVYGNSVLEFGEVFMALFPKGLTIDNAVDANRLALLLHVADKLKRYSSAFARGERHRDSLDDIAVYAQLLQHCDSLREKSPQPRVNEAPTVATYQEIADEVEASEREFRPMRQKR
jgi:hypothetical protein